MFPRALAFAALLLAALTPQQLTSQDRPNVVVIISDDQAWTDFGFMGHETIQTPHLDRLARQSAVFPRGYVPTALCRPSLATIITGLYAHQHGITGNDPPKGVARDRMLHHMANLETLPRMLGRAGYRSLQTGKWWEGECHCGGFSDGMTHGDPTRGGRHGDVGLDIGRKTMKPIYDFVDRCDESSTPFFLWYAPFLPHTPHNPPERLLKKYQAEGRPLSIARYYAMCEWFDETCGQLLNHLDSRKLTDNTIVLFVTDNGWIQRPRGRGYAARSKRTVYEGGVRTPIMVRWPGKVKPSRNDTLVSSIDLAPTVLAACGQKTSEELPGVNLLDVARGVVPARPGVFGASFTHDVVEVDNPGASMLRRWTAQGNWKWLEGKKGGPDELYRLSDDPGETTDVAAKHKGVVRRLRAEADRWWSGKARERPNLVFIVTDDQRADAMGCAGHPFLQTPNMDALAARGTRFTNAFVTTPICAASRASILTGAWETTHGYTFGTPPLSAQLMKDAWPRRLKEAGYHNGFFGKWGVKQPKGSTKAMFDTFEPMSAPYIRSQGEGVRHVTDLTADAAIRFLQERPDDGAPFCLTVSFNAPHAQDNHKEQYIPPPALADLYRNAEIPSPGLASPEFFASLPEFQQQSLNRVRWHWRFDTPRKHRQMVRNYCGMITGIDQAMGRIMGELQRQGLQGETVVIFTSDNGCFLGERGFAGKWTIHEESVRVPLIVYDPRLPHADSRLLDAMALNVDLAPTLLDLARVDIPDSYQGRSLTPLLRGTEPTDWRDEFFCEHRMGHKQIPKMEGIRGKRWVYTRYYEQKPVFEELYDLKNDPCQARNLAGDAQFAEQLAAMRQRCDARKAELDE